eukprot:TRINITY_DN4578_c0_g2_i11.p1 TRINITY_DN4578_c0_g2~~TRINITY_DN4578_c0_g2_i11.p1  ORF type:complete len:259 (+),score=33.57 TRINITY_DN4578_c0_g2_i11:160-936(+)
MDLLPQELICHIFSYEKPKRVLGKLGCVCRTWHDASHDIGLWRHYLISVCGHLDEALLQMDVRDLIQRFAQETGRIKFDEERALLYRFQIIVPRKQIRLPRSGPVLLVTKAISSGRIRGYVEMTHNDAFGVGAIISSHLGPANEDQSMSSLEFDYQLFTGDRPDITVCVSNDGSTNAIQLLPSTTSTLRLLSLELNMTKRIFRVQCLHNAVVEVALPRAMHNVPTHLAITMWNQGQVSVLTRQQYRTRLQSVPLPKHS